MLQRIRAGLILLAVAALAAGEAAMAPGSYQLYPGDLVKIAVYDHTDLNTDVRLPSNGMCSLPLIGEVGPLCGKSLPAAQAEIAKRFADGFIINPLVTLTVTEFGPRRAFVLGEVKLPNDVPLDPLNPTTALQAISRAGGFTADANRAGAVVVKQVTGGPPTVVAIPARDTPEALAQDVVLGPNDLCIVPRLDRIFILGQVKNPGAVPVQPDQQLTASRAISLCGGFERYSRQDQVQIIRPGAPLRTVDIRAVLEGKAGVEDAKLQPGDTVFVPETRY